MGLANKRREESPGYKTICYQLSAEAGGTAQVLPRGTVKYNVKPQGSVTLKHLTASTVQVDLVANIWSPDFYIDADGSTLNSITLIGSSVECHVIAHVDLDLCANEAVS